jgi:hypothetical protein
MSKQHYDVFVSYSKHDLPRVRLFVDALEAAGLSVFYDKKMPPGATWTQEIEDALMSSRFVLLCLTPSVIQSSFVEAEIRLSQDRVIPVLFENTGLNLVWEALIGRIQRVDLSQSQFVAVDAQFSRLLAVVTGQSSAAAGLEVDKLEALARQLIERVTPQDRCLVVALALMGGASSDDVSGTAKYFEPLLVDEEELAKAKLSFESFQTRLGRLHAEQFVRDDPRFGVSVDCARFRDTALGHRIFALAWSDYEALREAIVQWIDDWSAESPLWIRLRLALNLGVLAQDARRFDPTWRRVLRPLLFNNAARVGRVAAERFDVADAALAIAAMDPARRSTVAAILDDLIAEQATSNKLQPQTATAASGKDDKAAAAPEAAGPKALQAPDAPQPAAATTSINGDHLASGGNDYMRSYVLARLAFGYTGASFPDLAIRALRRLADKRRHQALVHILETSFRDAVSTAREAGDLSLRNPMDLLSGLLKWAHESPRDEQPLPLEIFHYGLCDLPLDSDDPTLFSLTSILKSKRGIACVRWGFLAGLTLHETRPRFEDLLREWRDRQDKEKHAPDPVAALACVLIHGANSEQDRDRVKFIFQHHYGDATISGLAVQAPALTERSVSCLSK